MDQSDLDLLQTVPAYHLQAVLKMRHVPLPHALLNAAGSSSAVLSSSSFPAAALQEVARQLFDADALQATLEDLSLLHRRLLRELVASGGRANSRDLALYFTAAGLLDAEQKKITPADLTDPVRTMYSPAAVQPPQYPQAHPHGAFEQALRHLLLLGLLFWGKQTNFAGRDYTSGIHDGVVVVPPVVREAVRQAWGLQDEPPAVPDDADVGEGARLLQRSLYFYWSGVAAVREGLPLVNNGLLARAALRHMLDVAGSQGHQPSEQVRMETDVPRLLFMRLLLMQLGLLREREGVLYAAPASTFFSLPLQERARRCFQLYMMTPFWNEMYFLPEVNVRPGPVPLEPAHEEVVHARQAVLENLLRQPRDEYSDLAAFVARMKLHTPYLLFPRQYGPRAERYSGTSNPYGWDFRLRRGWLTHREGWHMVEGGFIRVVIGGPLHWLGVVELDAEVGPTAFCVPLAAALITEAEAVIRPDAAWGRLIVQPNFELVALAPVSEALLINLDRFADRTSLEHIAQYRLTRASVTRAIQRGLHADSIQTALEQAAGGEIPQNVRYSLIEWERQARRVEIWQRATLLEVEDAVLLDALFEDAATRPLLGLRLSPTLAEVAPGQLRALQEHFWQHGYLPAMTNSAAADAGNAASSHEPQWRLHDSGLLQPVYAVLDLYLVAEVETFCIRDEATGWFRLTADSLGQALQKGRELGHIIDFLQRYCVDGIPGSLLIRLKLWGGGYEEQRTIRVEPAPLLSLSTEILQDLQADEGLGPLLGAEVEQQARLVRVDAQHLARVLELLRERGFLVEE